MLTKVLQDRFDRVWFRLQRLEHRCKDMSQIEVDEACVKRIEQVVNFLEAEATASGYDKLGNGWIG